MSISKSIGGAALFVAGAAFGQCAYPISLVESFNRRGNPEAGDVQSNLSAWTFRRSQPTDALLTGISNPTWSGGGWGATDTPYNIPFVGPRYSNVAERNQNPYYERLPSFEGLMAHPGYNNVDCLVVFRAPHTLTLSSIAVTVELLGNFSPNARVSVIIQRPGGDTSLIAPHVFNSLAPATSPSAIAGVLPTVLNAGDRVVLATNSNGAPEEDWVNLSLVLGLDGKPVVAMQQEDLNPCRGEDLAIDSTIEGATSWEWRRNGTVLPTQTGPVLILPMVTEADTGLYHCTGTNACGSTAMARFQITVPACDGDFDIDCDSDSDDVIGFFAAWEVGDESADVDGDGDADSDDIVVFFASWEGGC